MKKIYSVFTLLVVALAGLSLTACSNNDLDTDQFQGGAHFFLVRGTVDHSLDREGDDDTQDDGQKVADEGKDPVSHRLACFVGSV